MCSERDIFDDDKSVAMIVSQRGDRNWQRSRLHTQGISFASAESRLAAHCHDTI